ncbi:MAG: hemerythrin domain-containing protein [Bryobacteraceae bacterium]|nr:hemerythrin domain-containing protein [Bryobacteraceae bacterium]
MMRGASNFEMNIIDALLGEHAALLTVFDHIQKFSSGWDLGHLRETGSLLESLILTHAYLEDELLFDMIPEVHPGLAETLQAMHQEHRELRGLLRHLQEAENVREARGLLKHAMELAREHFAVEERVLFGLAGEVLGEDRLAALGQEWAERRHLSVAAV